MNSELPKRIFTGNYEECQAGNLISISGDRGRKVGFKGKAIPELAPKRAFWDQYTRDIGKIPQELNTKFYIREYYRQVLLKANILELLKDETDPILLCYEKEGEFCHRHILAEYIELTYGVEVRDITVDKKLNITECKRPENIRKILLEVMKQEKAKGEPQEGPEL